MTVDKQNGIWILGYGSLIYKPPPHYTHRIPAIIHGYSRRFWQSSTDHRGTLDSPGRVATLIPFADIVGNEAFMDDFKRFHDPSVQLTGPDDLTTLGVVYYIPEKYVGAVRQYLDVREQNGYSLHEVEVHLEVSAEQEVELGGSLVALERHSETGRRILSTSVYIGTVENEAFVGPEDLEDTARVIASSHGPSGSNYEYLKLLCDSLNELVLKDDERIADHYLDALFDAVQRIGDSIREKKKP